jgi:hypothetical protein
MFLDMKTSLETMDEFKKYLKENPTIYIEEVKFSVQILTTGFWPVDQSSRCILPLKAQRCANVFKDFYLSTHAGRRINWQYNMGFYFFIFFCHIFVLFSFYFFKFFLLFLFLYFCFYLYFVFIIYFYFYFFSSSTK